MKRVPAHAAFVMILPLMILPVPAIGQSDAPAPQDLARYYEPPAEYAGKFGPFRSPLRRADGSTVSAAAEWPGRRQESLATWQRRLGKWPALLVRPAVSIIETTPRQGFTQHHVHIQITNDGNQADGYLMVPDGAGPFPA